MRKDRLPNEKLFIDDNETEQDLLEELSKISDEEIDKINKEYENINID